MRLDFPNGAETRPTTDRVRESLFSSLQMDIPGCRFCDLYSGAGTIGIEALSRGAESAAFVDGDRRCIEALEKNLEHTNLAEYATVFRGQLPRCYKTVWQKAGPFDIVFTDPPYSVDPTPLLRTVAELCSGHGLLLILQCDRHMEAGDIGVPILRRKEYGKTALVWYEVGARE